jgi:G3E family GTPase
VKVRALADSGRFDYIIIESTGISEPLQVGRLCIFLAATRCPQFSQVAETFSFVDERDGSALIDHAFLDTMASYRDHICCSVQTAAATSLTARRSPW